jgi:hypothetical protein
MDTDNQEKITPNLFKSGLFDDDDEGESEYKDIRGGLRKRKRRS